MKNFIQYALCCSALLVLGACGGGGSSEPSAGGASSSSGGQGNSSSSGGAAAFDNTVLFTNLADNVIVPNYTAFKTESASASASAGAVTTYCNAIGEADESARLIQAQDQWRELMAIWQHAEVHNIGPAADGDSFLRNRIYSFDSFDFSSCSTDRAVITTIDPENAFDQRLLSARGLDALEYLLFEPSLEHTCPTENDQTTIWNTYTEQQKKQARCDYAELVVTDIAQAAAEIESGWLVGENNYRDIFVNADAQEVLKLLSDALFYIEKETKDAKLAVTLGIKDDVCMEPACPENRESPYSENSLQNTRNNFVSFKEIFNGATGVGFDDFIAAQDMASITTSFMADVDAAIALIDTMLASDVSLMNDAQRIIADDLEMECFNSTANPETTQTIQSCALHGFSKRVSDRLRTDFVTVVGVDLPDRVQGDTD